MVLAFYYRGIQVQYSRGHESCGTGCKVCQETRSSPSHQDEEKSSVNPTLLVKGLGLLISGCSCPTQAESSELRSQQGSGKGRY